MLKMSLSRNQMDKNSPIALQLKSLLWALAGLVILNLTIAGHAQGCQG